MHFHCGIPLSLLGTESIETRYGLMFNLIPELVQVIHAACEITILCNLFFVHCAMFVILMKNPVRIDSIIFPVNDGEHKTTIIDFQYRFVCCGIALVFHGINLPFIVKLGTENR